MDSKKKLDQRKKELVKQLRTTDELVHRYVAECGGRADEHKERWRQELQDIEQRRNDLFPEDQKMQKKSQNLRVCRTERSSARRIWARGLKKMSISGVSSKIRKMEDNGSKITVGILS